MHGGAADRSGLIHVGDEVCEVNGISVEGRTPSFVLHILVGNNKKHVFPPALNECRVTSNSCLQMIFSGDNIGRHADWVSRVISCRFLVAESESSSEFFITLVL